MGEFVGKLTNLSYEFFGVLLPGVIAHIFIFLVWAAMGPTAQLITYGWLPQLRLGDLVTVVDSITTGRGVGAVILLLVGWYFAGQLILWVSRSREKATESKPSNWQRVWLTLRFRTPRPKEFFAAELQPLYERVKANFEKPGSTPFEWRQFYPVAKNFLAQRVAYSLVATYQHKYTLHRSIACLSAMLFWALLAVAVIGLIGVGKGVPGPTWHLVWLGVFGALLLVWGFSESYRENWLMFGNTLITECYALFYSPDVKGDS